jgi:Zn-dependent protease
MTTAAPPSAARPARRRRREPGVSLLGVRVVAHPSLLIIVILLVVSLHGQFAAMHPGPFGPPAAALIVAALFVASITLHELAHSVAANAFGIGVRGITLFMFGGVSRLRREPARPLHELVMAAVGPLTSAALGAGALLLSLALPAASLAAAAASWLAWVNLGLAVFNLLPGFPLDGGRVLRAVVWGVTGDAVLATRAAEWLGSAIASAFMAGGLVLAMLGAVLNGLWIAFIGWFILGAVRQSRDARELQLAIAGRTVADVLRPVAVRVRPDQSVAEVVERLRVMGERCALVAGDASFISTADVASLAPERWAVTPASAVMRPVDDVPRVDARSPLSAALAALDAGDADAFVVTDGEAVAAALTREDVIERAAALVALR